MAQRVITQLISDLSGQDIAEGNGETVTFSIDGAQYEIDLTNKEADKFRGLFQDYIAVGRKVGGRRGAAKKPAASGPAASEIREWAQAQGLDVPARGRIPQEVRDQYDAAH